MTRGLQVRKLGRQNRSGELIIASADGTTLARIPQDVRDEMRYLVTRLEVHGGDLPHSIALTSYLSGEGVSFTSRALAAALARAGTTCLVEANWWGAGLPIEEAGPGLAGLLKGSAQLDETLVATDHVGLSLLPAGQLLLSDQAVKTGAEPMADVLKQLQARFRHVVVDLPAIGKSAVALTFAGACEASLLVVRQRVATIDQAENAVRDLRHTKLLGVVVNANTVPMPEFLRRRLLSS